MTMETRDEWDDLVSQSAQGGNLERIKIERGQLRSDIKNLCSTPEGLRFFRWFMSRSRLVDDVALEREAGARMLGCEVFAIIREVAPGALGAVLAKE